jgi:HEAT repeat protein
VLSPKQANSLLEQAKGQETYPQRDAVLFALRRLTDDDAGTSTATWQQIYPDAAVEVESDRMLRKLLQAGPFQLPVLLKSFAENKSEAALRALAAGMTRFKGGSLELVRDALARRMSEQSAGLLRGHLRDGRAGVRQAAVLACAKKKDKALLPDLIGRLEDRDAATVGLAASALKTLTGKDLDGAKAWQEWWRQGLVLER